MERWKWECTVRAARPRGITNEKKRKTNQKQLE